MKHQNQNINVIQSARKLITGASIIFVSLIISNLVLFCFRLFVARSLTLSEYGMFFGILSVLFFLYAPTDPGLSSGAIKYISEFAAKHQTRRIREVITFVFIVRFVLLVVATSLVVFFAPRAFGWPFMLTIILTTTMLVDLLHVFAGTVCQGFQDMRASALISICRSFSLLILVVLFFRTLNKELNSLALSYLGSSIFAGILGVHFVAKRVGLRLSLPASALAKKVLIFSLAAWVGGFGGLILSHIDTAMLNFLRPSADVGLYQIARPVFNVLGFLGLSLNVVMFPLASELWAKKQKFELGILIHNLLKVSFAIVVPLVFLIWSFSDSVIQILYGSAYLGGTKVLQVLSLGVLFYIPYMYILSLLGGIGKPHLSSLVIMSSSVLNLCGDLLLIPPYGATGAAIVTSSTYFFGFVTGLILALRHIKISIPALSIFKSLIGGVLITFFALYLKQILNFSLWPKIGAILSSSLFLYFAWEILVRVLTIREIKKWIRIIFPRNEK